MRNIKFSKTNYRIVAFALLMSVGVFSCKKENISDVNKTNSHPKTLAREISVKDAIRTEGDSVGSYHNQICNLVYQKVYRRIHRIDSAYTGYTPKTFIAKSIYDFLDSRSIAHPQAFDTTIYDATFSSIIATSTLSQDAKQILNQCSDLTNNYHYANTNSVQSLVLQCNNLIETALNTLNSDDEARIVVNTIAITKYSAQYWAINYNNYVNLFAGHIDPPTEINMDENAKKILYADAKAGLAGGFLGLGAGGVGFIPSAIVGGALGSIFTGLGLAGGFDGDWITVILFGWCGIVW